MIGKDCGVDSLDGGNTIARSKLPCQRFEASAKLRICDLPQALAEFLRQGAGLRTLRSGRPRRKPSLAEYEPIHRFVAEKAVDPFDHHRRDMLEQWGLRALNQQCQHSAGLAGSRKADRFRAGKRGIFFADDFFPAANNRALDEAEAAEGRVPDAAQYLARRARAAASRGLGGRIAGGSLLRHHGLSCHSAMTSANAANRLLAHYAQNARVLPWRMAPGTGKSDPYRVWLSEIMLQQTTVAAVIPRFQRFVRRWPTVEALAAAKEEDVLSEWAGLGYYARARNLIACAREVVECGAFPDTEAELRRLPGIGDYTAAAIAAIAFGQRSAVVDTNVTRVVARLHGLVAPTLPQVSVLVADTIPTQAPGDFAQAMMDLGATVCRPKAPLCGLCPLQADCTAAASGNPEQFPAQKIKAVRPHRFGTAYWIERKGRIWLVRRPPSGLLGGMPALPGSEWTGASSRAGTVLSTVRHVFTHFRLDLAVIAAREPGGDGWWQPLDGLADAGLPTLYRKAADAVLASPVHREAA